jgi:Winged helix DNA-binding domain
LQAQWPPSPYLALWSRIEGFRREQLSRAIERRRVVKATLMRGTLHHVSARDYLAYGGVFLEARLAELERRIRRESIDVDADALVEQLVAHTSDGPRSRPELAALLGLGKFVVDDPRPWVVWHLLVARAPLVHSPESSAWRRTTGGGRFIPAVGWLGRRPSADLELLVRRYLRAFGPASRSDLLQWTGLPLPALAEGLERSFLRRLTDERGRELLDVPRAPLPSGDTHAPVRFLPMWDSTLLAYADRARILPEEYRSTVIRRNGDVQPTFLVDGFVGGVWRLANARVELEAFTPLPLRVRRELEDERRRIEEFTR